MIKRCNAVGVRIYADAVINHMTGMPGIHYGSSGSPAFYDNTSYPAVPYNSDDFNKDCGIQDYNDPVQVRNCWLSGLADLNQNVEWVREKIVDYMNDLVDLGVAGFRIDAAKHMWPEDLENIYGRLKNLNTKHGFSSDARPFIYQEVIDLGSEGVKSSEYTHLATVIEFKYSNAMGMAFRGQIALKDLPSAIVTDWNMLPSQDALVFVDNHDNQRGHGAGGEAILSFKTPKQYKMATAFHLAFPYGIPNLMSSYDFSSSDQGPPHYSNGTVKSPSINSDGSCGNGWICEHRWRQIYGMIEFKNVVGDDADLDHWWDNGNNQIAFQRGNRGLIVFNGEANSDLDVKLQTSLPSGFYCDIASGRKNGYECTGNMINVECNGVVRIQIAANASDGFVAIHVGQKI